MIGLLAYYYSRSNSTEKPIEYLTRTDGQTYNFDFDNLDDARRYYHKAISLTVDATLFFGDIAEPAIAEL